MGCFLSCYNKDNNIKIINHESLDNNLYFDFKGIEEGIIEIPQLFDINSYSTMYYDYLCRIVFVGPIKTGKTKLFLRLTNNEETYSYLPTIGVDYQSINIKTITNKDIKLKIWDSSGDISFSNIVKYYLRGANFIFLFYDDGYIDNLFNMTELIMENKNKCNYILICDKPKTSLTSIKVDNEIYNILGVHIKYHFMFDFSDIKNIYYLLHLLY